MLAKKKSFARLRDVFRRSRSATHPAPSEANLEDYPESLARQYGPLCENCSALVMVNYELHDGPAPFPAQDAMALQDVRIDGCTLCDFIQQNAPVENGGSAVHGTDSVRSALKRTDITPFAKKTTNSGQTIFVEGFAHKTGDIVISVDRGTELFL
jgi:hypothetical protein